MVIYGGVMLWLLFFRNFGWTEGLSYREMILQNVNLKPFLTIENYLYIVLNRPEHPLYTHCLINLLGNVILFIPAGWLLPRIFPKLRNFFRFFTLCAILVILIEAIQLFTLLGSLDIDDFILNITGMVIGYLIGLIGHK